MSQSAAIRRRRQWAKNLKHLPKIGRSRYRLAPLPDGKASKVRK